MLLLPRQSSRRVTAPISPLSSLPGQQLILPNFVQYLRDRGIPGIGSAGHELRGCTVRIPLAGRRLGGNDVSGVFIGARTSTASKSGGQFGVFYPGVPLEPDRIATNERLGLRAATKLRDPHQPGPGMCAAWPLGDSEYVPDRACSTVPPEQRLIPSMASGWILRDGFRWEVSLTSMHRVQPMAMRT